MSYINTSGDFYPKDPKLTWPGWNDSGEDIGQGATDGKVWTFTTEPWCAMGIYPFVEYIYIYIYFHMYMYIYIYVSNYI